MMRATLWFLGLFALAVALALFAGSNQGVVSLFWKQHRIDLSLNLALLALCSLFALLYASLRGLATLGQLPKQARQGRMQRKAQQQQAHSQALEALQNCSTSAELAQLWRQWPSTQQQQPRLALPTAQQWLQLQGSPQQALQWLWPVWIAYEQDKLPAHQRPSLWQCLALCHAALDAAWLERFKQAQQRHPQQAELVLLQGLAHAKLGQPAEAQACLQGSIEQLPPSVLQSSAWQQLALLAEQRQDQSAAFSAWRSAALAIVPSTLPAA